MKSCIDCGESISKKSIRCKSCSNQNIWKIKNAVNYERKNKLISRNKQNRNGNLLYENREWMKLKYEKEKLSYREISLLCECSVRTVARWIKIHNLNKRSLKESISIKNTKNPKLILKPKKNLCPICLKNFKTNESLKCFECYLNNIFGQNNPNYKGISDITILVRSWSKRNWRNQILKRDNYICRECGESNKNILEAHHIKNLSSIIKEKINSYNINSEYSNNRNIIYMKLINESEITSMENGITLCKYCHRKKHTKGN